MTTTTKTNLEELIELSKKGIKPITEEQLDRMIEIIKAMIKNCNEINFVTNNKFKYDKDFTSDLSAPVLNEITEIYFYLKPKLEHYEKIKELYNQ